MYKKGKYVLVIGAVVVALLMISSACAVNVVQSNNVKSSLESESSDVYVDPNIHLSTKHLNLLKKALKQSEDPMDKQLLQSIIDHIEEKGIVKSNDISKIVNELDTGLIGIHCGFISGHGYNDGESFLFRGPIQVLLFIIEQSILLSSWQFVGIIAYWSSGGENPVRVNLRQYDIPHQGFIIGFLGMSYCGGSPWDGIWYRILGFGTLILVRDW